MNIIFKNNEYIYIIPTADKPVKMVFENHPIISKEESFGDKKQTGEEKLTKQIEYDKIKNEWCKNNHIKLKRIFYKEYDIIDLDKLIKE